MIEKGMYYVPSMNNYESKADVLILVTDFGMGRLVGVNVRNNGEHFEYDEFVEPEGFEYYYEPATNGEVLQAMFPYVKPYFDTDLGGCQIVRFDFYKAYNGSCEFSKEWWDKPYTGRGNE